MIKLRTKKIKNGYSLYLDYNYTHPVHNDKGQVKQVRKVEFLNLHVSHDYNLRKKIEPQDKETWELATKILKKRQLLELTNDRELLPKNDSASFIDFFESYLYEKKNHRTYTATLKHLKEFAGDKLAFNQINKDFIFRFQNYLKEKIQANSVNHYIQRFRIIWGIALKKEIITTNPFLSIDKLKKIEPTHTYLTLEEIKKLQDNCQEINPVIVNAFLFSCFTGLRFSDIQRLRWENIKENQIHYRQKKTNSIEHLPLGKQALSLLNSMPTGNELVFSGLGTNQTVNSSLRKWAKKADLPKDLHFHVGRHTFATLCLTSGIDIYVTSKLVGHKNINQTQIYAKIIDAKKDEAVSKLPELE
jgi:integrase